MRLFKKKSNQARKPKFSGGRSATFSYHSNPSSDSRPNLPRPRVSKDSFIWWIKRLPTVLTAIAVLAGIVYGLSLDPNNPRLIVEAPDNGQTSLLRPDVYEAAVKKSLGGSVLNRTKLTISSSTINSDLTKQFPEVSRAGVELSIFGRRPVIRIKIASAAILLISRAGSYIVDEEGRAVANVDNIGAFNQLSLVSVQDDSGLEINRGAQTLTREEVRFIQSLHYQLSAKKISVQSVSLPAIPKELRLKLVGQPYYIRLNLDHDSKVAAGTLIALLEKLNKDNVKPKEYIDLRVEERAYYK